MSVSSPLNSVLWNTSSTNLLGATCRVWSLSVMLDSSNCVSSHSAHITTLRWLLCSPRFLWHCPQIMAHSPPLTSPGLSLGSRRATSHWATGTGALSDWSREGRVSPGSVTSPSWYLEDETSVVRRERDGKLFPANMTAYSNIQQLY